jgi:hypothetical protein
VAIFTPTKHPHGISSHKIVQSNTVDGATKALSHARPQSSIDNHAFKRNFFEELPKSKNLTNLTRPVSRPTKSAFGIRKVYVPAHSGQARGSFFCFCHSKLKINFCLLPFYSIDHGRVRQV